MSETLRVLRPVLWVALAVGSGKFAWSLVGEPELLIRLHSLMIVQFGGALFLTFRIADLPGTGVRHLWLANLLLFAFCQSLVFMGMAYAWISGTPGPYHDGAEMTRLLGYDPGMLTHAWLHVLNWILVAPTIVTWLSGAPIIYLRRRRAR